MRVAREIHRPILEVLEYPMTELRLWAAVFQEEYFEQHPEERSRSRMQNGMSEQECDAEIAKMARIMKPGKKKR